MESHAGGQVGRTYHDSVPWWPAPVTAPAGAPNIVVIVLDDVGFSDFGCFGSDLRTPAIDGVADAGVRFTNFHTTAICSPTRACLLTGLNHHAVGMGVVSNWDTGFPGYRGRIAVDVPTLADRLRGAGYSTMAIGKWHLAPTDETTLAGPYDHWPLQRGFDRFYGFFDGATDHWVPDLVRDNSRIDPPRADGYHLSEDLGREAELFVRQHASVHPEKPFFLYLAFGAAHYPLQAPPPYLERVRGRYDDGWDIARARRFERQLELGVVPQGTALPPRNDDVLPWDELPVEHQRLACRLQEAYAAMLEHTDEQIARVLGALDAVGKRDDTLVVVLSDNGAAFEGGPLGSLNYMRKVNGLPPIDLDTDLDRIDEIGGPTTSASYPTGWAMVSNTPLKRYKQKTHGGGIRDPLIVSWPSGIDARGAVRDQFAHAIDVAPTLLDLAGVATADEVPMHGASLAPALRAADAPPPRPTQYFEMVGNRGIWHEGWKAVTSHVAGTPFDDDRWELYHLERDFSEHHDLAAAEPRRLEEMVARWWEEAERYDVLPLDDRVLERFLVPKPRPITDRREFVYYAPLRVPSDGMPDVRNVSYSITAVVERRAGDDGVIVACGDRFSGYALFVQDGRVVHDYNTVGTHHVVTSDSVLPEGMVELAYLFDKTGDLVGRGRLLVDGVEVAAADVGPTLGRHLTPMGMAIGSNPLSAVSPRYDAPFPFAGTIRTVRFRIGDDRVVHPQTSIQH
jgi:arylsulfatase A-like enzyme